MESEQGKSILEHYDYLTDERIVTSKDVAFDWMLKIGIGYDDAETVEDYQKLVNELMAYAKCGLDCCE